MQGSTLRHMHILIRRAVPLTVLAIAGCAASTPGPASSPAAAASASTATAAAPATSSPASSTATRVTAWYSGSGGAALRHLAMELSASSAADEAATSGNIAGAAHACDRLARAVTRAEAAPPIPGPHSQMWYVRALAKFQKSAVDCSADASAGDLSVLSQSTVAMAAGAADIGHVTADIKRLASTP